MTWSRMGHILVQDVVLKLSRVRNILGASADWTVILRRRGLRVWPVSVQRAACGHKAQSRCQAEMGGHAARNKQGQLDGSRDTPRLRLHTAGHKQASAPHTATTWCLKCPGVQVDPLPFARNVDIHLKTYGELQGAAHM